MNQIASMGSIGIWIGILSVILLGFCLYFTLSYFEHLKYDDDRLMKQTKMGAVITLVLALLVPAFFQLFIFSQMMSF
ncbi:hypothetical protein [Ureibacillus acetophenoni]|uniref:Uncharacterized protein n=1 Tax=Ureibacillus acetophenoni TaxID=614649 RepID=A0A285URD6_9BACL|nr:hypothetical protein [Ureibacillus acetophenoni]SOC44267.1 hypothetical protein SAMN05877842_11968 [Ureibacillus acetophenoni]